MKGLIAGAAAVSGGLAGRLKRLVRRPRRRVVVIAAAGVLAAGGVAFAVLGGGGEQASFENASGESTAVAERRDLSETLNESGDLGFSGSDAVIARQDGTLTWLPSRGKVIGRGERLFEVDELPVTLMFGRVPAYRDLEAGVEEGADVRQLERNLAALGFDPYGEMTADTEFTSATTDAIVRWQESIGVEETGSVTLGQVVFMEGRRRVSDLELSLGASIGGSGGTGAVASTGAAPAFAATLVAYETDAGEGGGGVGPGTGDTGDGEETPEEGTGGGVKPPEQNSTDEPKEGEGDKSGEGRGETGEPSATPSTGTLGAPSGSGGTAPAADDAGAESEAGSTSTEVMSTTSVRRAVTVELESDDQEFAKKGAKASVGMPDGSSADGRVTEVTSKEGEAAADDPEAEPEVVIEVVIRLDRNSKGASRFAEAPVTVELKRVLRKDVLTVPVTAIGSGVGGGYTVTVVGASGETEVAEVETGEFSDGYVEIEGGGIKAGTKVEVPG